MNRKWNMPNPKYLSALSRIFTPLVLDNIAQKGHSSYLTEVCANGQLLDKIDQKSTFAEFLNWIYSLLLKNYRNEYIYKNVIANKILLGKHSLKTSQMLTEFRVGKCKADVVIINGTSTVYEIKSEYDSFNRLKSQISTYMQVFDHINVVTSKQQIGKVLVELPTNIGILTLSGRNSISTIRKSISNKENINTKVLFDSLRKCEYIQIINSHFGSIPDVPNTKIFNECKNIFSKMDPKLAHDVAMSVLKKRNEANIIEKYLEESPSSLAAYIISNANNSNKLQALVDKLSLEVRTVLSPA